MDGTQRALFSLLFGAGIILFVGRKENILEGLQPADYFFRRQLWLIVLSLFDVFILLWNGDILLDYACLGMVMFTFRKLSPRALIMAAAICLLFMLARENRDFYKQKRMIVKGEAIATLDTTQTKLTDRQKEELESMTAFKERSTRASKLRRMARVNQTVQGNYASVYEYRTNQYLEDLVPYLYFQLWDVQIFMLLGMAFLKMGILTGDASVKVYAWMTVAGFGLGLMLSYYRVQSRIDRAFNWFEYTKQVSLTYFSVDRVGRSIGILGLIMLLYKSGWFTWLFSPLRPVGQMA